MYTGIVQALLPVAEVEELTGLRRFHLDFPEALMDGLELGASVGLNGVCLTVTAIEGSRVSFEAIVETLRITNLSGVENGTLVNVERSARAGVEVGGHILAGHVVDTAPVLTVEHVNRLTPAAAPSWPYPPGGALGVHKVVVEGEPRVEVNTHLSHPTLDVTDAGCVSTAARAVNAIDWVCRAPAGLIGLEDIPPAEMIRGLMW